MKFTTVILEVLLSHDPVPDVCLLPSLHKVSKQLKATLYNNKKILFNPTL